MMFDKEKKDHIISKAEIKKWRDGKNKTIRETPKELSLAEKRVFVEICSKNSSTISLFQRKLGLDQERVNFYKNKYNIKDAKDARSLLSKMNEEREKEIRRLLNEEAVKAKEARVIAERRLQEMDEAKRIKDENFKKSILDIRKKKVLEAKIEDAERRRKFEESERKKNEVQTNWRLPIESETGESEIRTFTNDLRSRGLKFTMKKYGISKKDIKSEASRLKLNINWDLVRS